MAPLWKLCYHGNLDEDSNGMTALMNAVGERHNSIVKLLLDQQGVKINEKDDLGFTALHDAAYVNNREAARMLLLHPTMDSTNSKDNYGETAVMVAVVRKS